MTLVPIKMEAEWAPGQVEYFEKEKSLAATF